MASGWPRLLFAVHCHKSTTSWCFLSLVPPTAHPPPRKTHVTTKGLRPRPYSYSAQGPIRERTGREGNEHLLGSFHVPGRAPNSSTERELGPQSVSDWACLALSLHLKSFILSSHVFFSISLHHPLSRVPKLATASAPERQHCSPMGKGL